MKITGHHTEVRTEPRIRLPITNSKLWVWGSGECQPFFAWEAEGKLGLSASSRLHAMLEMRLGFLRQGNQQKAMLISAERELQP